MSKRAQTKDIPNEDNSESSVSVRRSSRISSNQTAVGSPAPRGITTRRGSASSNSEKIVNGDGDRYSPVIEKRKTRRTSTDSETNMPTPIKTRRSSISKIIEEEKKPISSPGTPSRRTTRSASRSPSSMSDIPARRTRKSSQDSETTEQQPPPRRSTRRRPSADTQEDAAEVEENPKPVTRRRRSTSLDEQENVKTDAKPKTKKLFSEDNQLEPIPEKETELQIDKSKTVHDLSIIQENEDAEVEESEKIIKDIDDVLQNDTPKPMKSGIKSIFSPITPKTQENATVTKTKDKDPETLKNTSITETKRKDSPKREEKVVSDNSSGENIEKEENITKETESTEEKNESEVTSINSTTEPKKFISEGSDDSFTLKLNESINKSHSTEEQKDDDVFSSPGSNKENSSINIPSRNVSIKQRHSLNKSKEAVVTSSTKPHPGSYEPMEVDNDDDLFEANTPKSDKVNSSTNEAELELNSSKTDVASNSPILNKSKNASIREVVKSVDSLDSSFVVNTSLSDKDNLNSSISSGKNSINSSDAKNISSTSYKKPEEDDDDSDLSIRLVDSEDERIEEEEKSTLKIENVKRSKRPRMSDGTSKNILMRLQQDVGLNKKTEKSSIDEDLIEVNSSSDDSSEKEADNEKELDVDEGESNVAPNIEDLNEKDKSLATDLKNDEKTESSKVHEEKAKEKIDAEKDSKASPRKNTDISAEIDTESPLKSKIEKMKACGVNFANDSPAKPKVRLTESANARLEKFLMTKLDQLVDDDSTSDSENSSKKQKNSNDKSMSDDFERNEFVDEMAEEGHEDTPSEGSNDIHDAGESINTTETEGDSDDTYDLNDSFIVDESEGELLPGDEYDLEINGDFSEEKKLKRKRIVEKQDSSSDDDREENDSKIKSPPKRASLEKSVKSPKEQKTPSVDKDSRKSIPLIRVSSPGLETSTPSSIKEKLDFEEKIRSFISPKIANSPNVTLNDAANSSKHNVNSGRSSSIIIQENVSVSEMQSNIITDKLQQVVKVFCAGLRSSDGNISMNVSLEYVETPSKTPANNADDDVIFVEENNAESSGNNQSNRVLEKRKSLNVSQNEIEIDDQKQMEEAVSPIKKRRSSQKFDKQLNDNKNFSKLQDSFEVSQVDTSELKESANEELSQSKKKRRSSKKFDKSSENVDSGVIQNGSVKKELEFSVSPLKKRVSLSKDDTIKNSLKIENESSVIEESKLNDSVTKSSKKRRRSSKKFDKSSENLDSDDIQNSSVQKGLEFSVSPLKKRVSLNKFEKDDTTQNVPNSPLNVQNEASVDESKLNDSVTKSSKKKRRSSNKFDSQLNVSNEVKEQSPNKVKETETIPDASYEKMGKQIKEVIENHAEVEKNQVKTKKNRNKKRKSLESIMKQEIVEKRAKLIEMACEEIAANDITSKLPSRSELVKPDKKTDKKRLKRLQSELKFKTKYALLGNLITDVKNRPKRSMAPSSSGDNSEWSVVEGNAKPSKSNETDFDQGKISAKDFKNQMIYDSKIKREPTSKLLRNKGYYY